MLENGKIVKIRPMDSQPTYPDFLKLNARDREAFLRELVLELAHTLKSVVGTKEAEGFGKIAAESVGQANVEISESIAAGDSRCRVIVRLNTEAASGVNFYRLG